MNMELSAGFVIGLVGSMHCIGMCGPIAASLPSVTRAGWRYLLGRFLYNIGRIAAYMMLGAAAGLIGRQFAASGLQQQLSIAVGVAMILTAAAPVVMNRFWMHLPLTQTLNRTLKGIFASAFRQRTLSSMFIIGAVNGLLPCGLVYMAAAGAAATGSMGGGLALMAGFGAGTVPVMMAVSLAGGLLSPSRRRHLSRWAPALIFVLGVVLILRGLNLGIPMVSPKIPVQTSASQSASVPPCCGI